MCFSFLAFVFDSDRFFSISLMESSILYYILFIFSTRSFNVSIIAILNFLSDRYYICVTCENVSIDCFDSWQYCPPAFCMYHNFCCCWKSDMLCKTVGVEIVVGEHIFLMLRFHYGSLGETIRGCTGFKVCCF